MNTFELDPRLAADTFPVGDDGACQVLLMDNAALPWLIVVPRTPHTELCELPAPLAREVAGVVERLSRFLLAEFALDKLNIAAIGNVVRQLHVHVVGRRHDDYCWPGVVWGTTPPARYPPAAAAALAARARAALRTAPAA